MIEEYVGQEKEEIAAPITPKVIDLTPKDIKTEDIPNLIRQTKLTLANLHEYVYSLPVSALCSGCYTIKEMEANIKVLKRFKQLSVDDMERLVNYAKPHSGIILENYKRILA